MIMEETKKENDQVSGAGFIVFRKDTLSSANPLMLALVRSDKLLDIPKGTIDKGETSISAAKRECFEECSIVIDDSEMLFEGKAFTYGPLEVFCAATDKTPAITRNPATGIMEHDDYQWVSKDEFCASCLDYLTPSVNHFYSAHDRSYNNI